MKTLQFKSIVILVCLLFTIACSDEKDEDDPLRLPYYEDNRITMLYPKEKSTIEIAGGVQPYSVYCESDLLKVYIDKDPNYFQYEVLGVGEATIEISDAMGQKLYLDAVIKYSEWSMEITEHSVYVEGDHMTIADQNELKDKVLASIPVKVGGGYKFIFTERESGTVYVYKENFGGEYSEGTFSIKNMDNTTRDEWVYNLKFDGEEHNYLHTVMVRSRSIGPLIPYAFSEELTDKYKEEYPEVELVSSYQTFLK